MFLIFSKLFSFSKILWASVLFDWYNLFFRSIVSVLTFLKKPLSVSINRNWFSINRKMWIRFFKNGVWLVQPHFSKVFQTFLSLSPIWIRLILNFLLFSSGLFARFSSLQAGKSIIPYLLHLFSCFHAFFHAFCWDFRTYSFWDFCWF